MRTAFSSAQAQIKRIDFTWVRNLLVFGMLFMLVFQGFAQKGQEPQSLENTDFQSQFEPKSNGEGIEIVQENAPSTFWMKRLEKKFSNQKFKITQPNKPLPEVYLVLGSLCLLLWLGLLLVTILAVLSSGIFLLMLLLTILLSPLAILGIILIIGGIKGLSA